jgi:hypothetical protein
MASPKIKDAPIKVKMTWGSLRDIPTIHSDQLLITAINNEYYLVFGETELIGLINKENPPKEVAIKPVAKIAVNPQNILKFDEVIHKTIEIYRQTLKAKAKK